MKPLLLCFSLLLSGCVPTSNIELVIYDYEDVSDARIKWSDIFSQEEDQYSVYFYSVTCGHCAEIKQNVLSYYFLDIETMYFVQTDEETKFGAVVVLTGISDIDLFHIFGTPFLVNIKEHSVSSYCGGVNSILKYIDENTK